MFKALTATAAVIICCLGNQYPAKADYYQQMQLQRQQREMEWKLQKLEQEQRRQQRQQRYGGQW